MPRQKMAADRPCSTRCRRAVEQQLGPRARAATARSGACGRRAHGQQRCSARVHSATPPPKDPPALLPCVWASAAGSRSGLGHGASLHAHPPGTLVLAAAAAVLPSSLAHRRRFKGRQPPAALACLGPAERQTPLAFSCGSVRSQKRLSAHLDASEQPLNRRSQALGWHWRRGDELRLRSLVGTVQAAAVAQSAKCDVGPCSRRRACCLLCSAVLRPTPWRHCRHAAAETRSMIGWPVPDASRVAELCCCGCGERDV
jgi:hypothetical protein